MDILYTINETGAAVFAERSRAESVARIRSACESSTTWGEFRSHLSTDEYAEILDAAELEEDEIEPDKDFGADAVPGYADGDYPEWLQQTMLTWFPPELAAEYGARQDSVLNGDFLELAGEKADRIAESLRALGHTVTRSDLEFR